MWRKMTQGGHEVVVYASDVPNIPAEGDPPNHMRTVFGRVRLEGRWLPQAWSKYGRAFDMSPHSLDLVPDTSIDEVAA